MSGLRIPLATYRLQCNRQLRFEDAKTLVPYLYRLGISDLYASPILKARSRSLHGYDVTDPSQFNPELGTTEEFDTLAQTLKQHEMGLLLDIVPNHMAASPENPWWMDFLENGWCSPYAIFFDIGWNPPDINTKEKVVLPILDKPYKQALENQEFTLRLEDAGLFIVYQGHRLPLDVKSYFLVLSYQMTALEAAMGFNHPHFQPLRQLIDDMEHLAPTTKRELTNASEHYKGRQLAKESFLRILNISPEIKTFVLQNITFFNGKKGEPSSFKLLHRLLEQQVYRLAFWKTAREHINYRRFFDVSDLIGIRVEELKVFEATHALVSRLAQEGKVTGLRVDHIDGLYEPLQYLSRLQHYIVPAVEETMSLPDFYIVVEKILTGSESLPEEWPVFGTTGYDFLNTVNSLFVDGKRAQTLNAIYFNFTGSTAGFDDIVYEKKRQVIAELFPSEVNALGKHLAYLARQHSHTHDLSQKELKRALTEVTACLPVYRTYLRTLEASPRNQLYLRQAVQEAGQRNPAIEAGALDFLKRVLSMDFPDWLAPEQRQAWLHFVLRWQQLTGAIMAKGFEDTALYSYNRLVSLNEVGGAPASTGLSVEEFHQYNLARLAQWPHTINATSTHDTKRSEDVRARINVLSEFAEEWGRHLDQWTQWNRRKKQRVHNLLVPEANMEIFIYQTLIGAWPLCQEEVPQFVERLKACMLKAAREAKVFTRWLSPNPEYESALIAFLESILESSNRNEFLKDLLQFEKKIAYYGALNSLAQVLLKITSPGVPDFYQGTELWDFSLMDPDNRRPIDFKRRVKHLNEIIQQEAQDQQSMLQQALSSWEDGRLKLYVTYKALNVRKSHKHVFIDGQYIPLQVTGKKQEHVCAYARHKGEVWVLIVVPRLLTKLVHAGTLPLGQPVWKTDRLLLPENAPERWLNTFTGERLKASGMGRELALSDIFYTFPLALLTGI